MSPTAMTEYLTEELKKGRVCLAHSSKLQSILAGKERWQEAIAASVKKPREMSAQTSSPTPPFNLG